MASQLYTLALCVCFAFLIPSNYAIKCYQCSSNANQRCADLTDTNIQATDCVANQIHNSFNNVLKAFGGSGVDLPKEVEMVCQKLIYKNNTNIRVERSCQFKDLGQSPCEATKQALTNLKTDTQITFCDVCNKDGCNGASNHHLYLPLMIAAPIYLAIKLLA